MPSSKEDRAWISDKISKLRKEGMPEKQAVAVAYDMNKKRKKSGRRKR